MALSVASTNPLAARDISIQVILQLLFYFKFIFICPNVNGASYATICLKGVLVCICRHAEEVHKKALVCNLLVSHLQKVHKFDTFGFVIRLTYSPTTQLCKLGTVSQIV
jgi:hypothetical protein